MAMPILTSLPTIAGNRLVLTFDQALDEAIVPPVLSFIVVVDRQEVIVSAVEISGSAVTLTLALPVLFGEVVFLNFDSGTGTIANAAGDHVADMISVPVTNTTPLATLDASALIKRTLANADTANTFATYAELMAVINQRADFRVIDPVPLADRVRFIIQAYRDLDALTWVTNNAYAFSSQTLFSPSDFNTGTYALTKEQPPLNSPGFAAAVTRAQAAQVLYLISGTQIRDMAAEGVRLTRSLSGVETEITGYRGRVCVEAIEIISRWVELMPRLRRM